MAVQKASTRKADYDTIIVRFGGEIWTKKPWTRHQYERLVLENIKRNIKFHSFTACKITRMHGRIFIKTEKVMEASHEISKVFGISSLSPALETSSAFNDIIDKSLLIASGVLEKGNAFAVRCRRVGSHPYGSRDVCREVGQQILDRFGEKYELRVDLKSPNITFGIDVREDKAFIFDRVFEGQGGLPLGAQQRLIGLVNGESSSAVACWLAMKRGCSIVPLYFDNARDTDESTTKKTIENTKALLSWAIGFPRHLYLMPNERSLEEIEKSPSHLAPLIYKRMAYRIAEKIAEMFKAEGIVTGETLGAPENLTLHDFNLLSEAARYYPVHRPLLGFDTNKIQELAEKIGLHPSQAETKPLMATSKKSRKIIDLQEIVEAEKRMNVEEIIDCSVKSLRVLDL